MSDQEETRPPLEAPERAADAQSEDTLRQELDYYRKRVDELAGQVVRADSVVSRTKRELKQRRQGFALLTELHRIITTDMTPASIFGATCPRLEKQLKMDRTIILQREGDSTTFQPIFFRGFPTEAAERLRSIRLSFPDSLLNSDAPLLVTQSSPADDFIRRIRHQLEVPFFVCAMIAEGEQRDYLLLSGRMREARPFFPPLDEGDVYTLQSIAGFLGAAVHNSSLFAHTVRMARSFARFVPTEFLEFLSRRSIIDVGLGDQTQQVMTVLFSDIRAFTTMSERMSPKETFDFVNRYLMRAAPVIRSHGGFIDKFIGDAIMALFPGSPVHALRAANDLQHAVREFNRDLVAEGGSPIATGVGLHTGMLMLGTIGFEERMDTTVISDAVNLASRLEGLTKLYGVPVIASGDTISSLEETGDERFATRSLDRVQAKGKSEPVDILEVFDAVMEEQGRLKHQTRPQFERSFHCWLAGDFEAALAGYETVLAINSDDRAARLYQARCHRFLREGPPPGWNGVTLLDHK